MSYGPDDDPDGDGATNIEEFVNGGNPAGSDTDTDHDGMPNWWEDLYGLNSTDPSDAYEDADGDGSSNLEEYNAGSDPTDPLSPPPPPPLPPIVLTWGGNASSNIHSKYMAAGGAREPLTVSFHSTSSVPGWILFTFSPSDGSVCRVYEAGGATPLQSGASWWVSSVPFVEALEVGPVSSGVFTAEAAFTPYYYGSNFTDTATGTVLNLEIMATDQLTDGGSASPDQVYNGTNCPNSALWMGRYKSSDTATETNWVQLDARVVGGVPSGYALRWSGETEPGWLYNPGDTNAGQTGIGSVAFKYGPAATNYLYYRTYNFVCTLGELDGTGSNFSRVLREKTIPVNVLEVDLDIDSDCTTAFGGPDDPDGRLLEDDIESLMTAGALKYVVVNDWHGQGDTNGIPGYADGYDLEGTNSAADDATGPDYEPTDHDMFAPVKLTMRGPFNGEPTEFKFTYSQSWPSNVAVTITPRGKMYEPNPGLRLWTRDQDEPRSGQSVTNGIYSNFVESGVWISASNFPAAVPGNRYLWLEAVSASSTNDGRIKGVIESETNADRKITVELRQSNMSYKISDVIRFTAIRADVDVDSDNNEGFDPPARTDLTEDHYEDMTNRPGKIIAVNDNDDDQDGVPDFADGYSLPLAGTNGQRTAGEHFVPIVFEISKAFDPAATEVKITFMEGAAASDPLGVTTNAEGFFLPADGTLRMWNKNGSAARNGTNILDGGNYIPPGTYPALAFGFSSSVLVVTNYLEAVRPSTNMADQRILFEVNPKAGSPDHPGFIAADAVRLTVLKVDIQEIRFDHNTAAMTDDGVTIKKDKDTDVTAPEWKSADSKNDPACYIKSKTPKVKVKLKVQPDTITSAKIRAVAENGRLPNLTQKTVTFSGGVSGLEEFTMATAIAGVVTNILESWQWKISDVNGSGSAECDVAKTGEHRVYAVLDTPKDPMAKPWTNILEVACHVNWASGQNNAAPAVEAIGKAIYQSLAPLPHQINYDGSRPWYSYKNTQAPDELGDGWYFHLTEFLADISAANVNFSCSCVANFYEIVIAAIGVDGQWKALDVDPAAGNLGAYISGGTGISCNWYDPIGTPGWTDSDWIFHQVLLHNGNIYDACIKADSNNDPVNHNPVWTLGLGETAYEGLLGSYDNSATKTGDTELK